MKVIENGSRLQASFGGSQPVFVLGYQGEQYLRIDQRGVFENLRSPATYINKTRNGTNPPGTADPRGTRNGTRFLTATWLVGTTIASTSWAASTHPPCATHPTSAT